METDVVTRLAHRLLQRYGLNDWQFDFDHSRVRMGCCHFDDQTITLSRHFVAANTQTLIEQTLKHEIAHALVGPGHGHDAVWQAKARALGVAPRASSRDARMPLPKWALVCMHCGQVVARRHRKRLHLARVRCADCGIEQGHLNWILDDR